jgi:hypothetical protein
MQFINEGKEKCKTHIENFGNCAKEAKIFVVFNCRAQNKAMSDCKYMNLIQYNLFLLP